jgi:hypothetical protein
VSITAYGETSICNWAQSAFKERNLPITPKGVKYYKFLKYCEEDQNFDAELALKIEQEDAKNYKEFLLDGKPLIYTIYIRDKKIEENKKFIDEFIAQAKVEVIRGKYPHGDTTHYTRG